MNSLLKTALRDALRRPWQSALMILGVALGVAVIIAINLANTSARTAFALSTEAVVGKATHMLVGGPAGLPDDLFRQVRVEWGYRLSAPVVEGVARAPDLNDQPLRILGVDPIADAPFRNYTGQPGQTPGGFEAFYTVPGATLLSVDLASRYGLTFTSAIRLQVNDEFRTLTVAGLLEPTDEGTRRALDTLLITDIASAQELLRQTGRLSRIDLILTAAEARALAAQLPPGVQLVPATQQADTVAQLTEAFQLNLTALSLLALVVGMFLIYNTIMFSVVQRRHMLGILRALGATDAQIFFLILVEAGLVGLVGSALGLGLGWALGQGAVQLVTQTINDLYFVVSVREAPLTLDSAALGVALGVGASLLAAAAPAWEAANVPPITAMRRSTLEERVQDLLPRLALAGLALGAFGAGLILLPPGLLPINDLFLSFGGLFAVVIGLALLVPWVTAMLMTALAQPLRRVAGVLGEMAARTVVKALSRTSVAIAALMVAVSVTIGVSVMIASFRTTVINWLDLTLIADVYISAPALGGTRGGTTLEASVLDKVRQTPGVGTVETIRTVTVASHVGPLALSVSDAQQGRAAALYRFAQGDAASLWAQVQAGGALIVSEPLAYRHNLINGGTLTLTTDSGPRAFDVVGVYYDYASDQGTALMSRTTYEQFWGDRAISGVAVYVAPGAAPAEVAEALRANLRGSALQVQVNRALRDQALVIFDRTFAITDALRVLAVIVAFIGVLSALMALQLERARELATLQALGLTGPQLWRLTLTETGLMGATAGLLSLPVGFVMAVVLIYVINLRSFGWSITMQNDPLMYGQAFVVSVVAAVLAAIYPMRRLLGVPIVAALRQE